MLRNQQLYYMLPLICMSHGCLEACMQLCFEISQHFLVSDLIII